MTRLPTPATLVLHAAGLTVTAVAHTASIAQPSVSAQLAGRRLLQDKTLEAIRTLAGHSVAEEVRAAAAQSRASYLHDVQAGRL
ncbi:MAG: hypothetical protein QNJ81_02860 [Acidimicrobiia bacterium]|nr:hypothetical protein [Acidimicrobiia bacterium]